MTENRLLFFTKIHDDDDDDDKPQRRLRIPDYSNELHFLHYTDYVKVKVKQSRYRSRRAQSVPGS